MTRVGFKSGKLWLVSALVLACMVLVSQVGTAQAQSARTFRTIDIEGNQRIEDSTILTYAGIAPGESVTTGEINAAFQRVTNSGLFEDVDIVPSGDRLVITVKEYPTVNRISIEGNRRIDDELLTPLLESKPRRVYSPNVAENDARLIAEAYRQSGRLAATVTPKLIPRSQNRVDIVFEVTEGATVEVERIGFVGNRKFSDRRLRNVLSSKQAGIFRSVVARDSYVEDRVAFDRQVLTDFYQSRGYVDFQVLSVTSEFSQERDAFFITFNLREGRQFKFGEIKVASDVTELAAADYEGIVRTRPGQLYSPLKLEESIARLERQLVREGRDFIRVNPVVDRDDRGQILNITYTLERGPRIFVERIDIEGNTNTRDEVVRRQFDTIEGDPFNPREIRQAATRIRALGFFSQAEVNTREGTSPDRVIVDVDVEEQPTGSIGFGLNYSVGDGFGGSFNLSERNFLGRGQTLAFSLAAGVDNTQGSIRFYEPAMLGRNVSGGFEIFYESTEQYSADYDTREFGFVPSIGFQISEYSRLSLRYRLADEDLYNVDTGDDDDSSDNGSSEILQREEGNRITSSIGYTWSWDTRRVGLDPKSGIRLEFSQDVAGLGGDNEYLRTTALLAAETMVWGEDLTLRMELEGGALNMFGGENSRITDRFGAGRRVRGFERNGIGPRDEAASNEDALGGNYFAALRMEMVFPLGLPEEYGVNGGFFFDAGSVWGLDDTEGTDGVEVDDDFILRSVIGASLFWTTPLGPLRFDFSHALQKEDYDEEQTFDFRISARF